MFYLQKLRNEIGKLEFDLERLTTEYLEVTDAIKKINVSDRVLIGRVQVQRRARRDLSDQTNDIDSRKQQQDSKDRWLVDYLSGNAKLELNRDDASSKLVTSQLEDRVGFLGTQSSSGSLSASFPLPIDDFDEDLDGSDLDPVSQNDESDQLSPRPESLQNRRNSGQQFLTNQCLCPPGK